MLYKDHGKCEDGRRWRLVGGEERTAYPTWWRAPHLLVGQCCDGHPHHQLIPRHCPICCTLPPPPSPPHSSQTPREGTEGSRGDRLGCCVGDTEHSLKVTLLLLMTLVWQDWWCGQGEAGGDVPPVSPSWLWRELHLALHNECKGDHTHRCTPVYFRMFRKS